MRAIFWGNSRSLFSNRHFDALMAAPCKLAAIVDTPGAKARGVNQVSTNPLAPGQRTFVDLAQACGIPVLAPENLGDPDFVHEIQQLTPDIFIAAGYDKILKPAILAVPRFLAMNFHASLLPYYRGKHPVFWTLRSGERWAGLTVHVMDPGIDTGDIIYQVKVRTRRDDTVSSLYERIMTQSVKLIGLLVGDVEKGSVPRRAQRLNEGSYFSSITDDDYAIDWSWNSEKIRRWIVMTPGRCFSTLSGLELYYSQAETARNRSNGKPGTLLNLGRTRCLIASGDGAVWIGQARIGGGELQPLASICREIGYEVGDVMF